MRRTMPRALLVLLVVGIAAPAEADAKPRRAAKVRKLKRDRQIAVQERRDDRDRDLGQSVGRPAAGRLNDATQLRLGDGAHIRRPWRAFGTRTAVHHTQRVIEETLELIPPTHVLGIGDMSAERGGPVSDHHSHQSGRDLDVGLFYKRRPSGYPSGFIAGTEENLDAEAMWTLISKFAATANRDGGVQIIYLDYDVQGIVYRWAREHGVSDAKLERIFQYPNGRDEYGTIVRHYRNHANHLHVRFKCANADVACR
jgi:murein endopeptidase